MTAPISIGEFESVSGIRDGAAELYFVPTDPMDLLQCDSCQ